MLCWRKNWSIYYTRKNQISSFGETDESI